MDKELWKKLLLTRVGPPNHPVSSFEPAAEWCRLLKTLCVLSWLILAFVLSPFLLDLFLADRHSILYLLNFMLAGPVIFLVFLFAFCLTAVLRNRVLAAMWEKRFDAPLPFRMFFSLHIPLIRLFLLIPLTARLTHGRSDIRVLFFTVLSVVAALGAWISFFADGFWGSNVVFLMMLFVMISDISLIKRLTGAAFSAGCSRYCRGTCLAWLAVYASLSIGAGRLTSQLAQEKERCRMARFPLERTQFLLHFSGGGYVTDSEFIRMVDSIKGNADMQKMFAGLQVDVTTDLRNTEKHRARRAALECPAVRDCFRTLDPLLEEKRILKYPLRPGNDPLIAWELPHIPFYQTAAWAYYWRILDAGEQGDSAEAMRKLRLYHTLLDSMFRSETIVAALTAIHAERLRLEAVSRLIGLGILSYGDLKEIQDMNRGRSVRIRRALARGIRGDAAVVLDRMEFLSGQPLDFLKEGAERPWKRYFLEKTFGTRTPNHVLFLGMRNHLDRQKLFLLRFNREMVRYFSEYGDLYLRKQENASLDALLSALPRGWHMTMMRIDWSRLRHKFERTCGELRMCDLALHLEILRRQSGKRPEIPGDTAPDPVSGQPFQLTDGRIRIWTRGCGRDTFEEFDGWQISGAGDTLRVSTAKVRESLRDRFNVITEKHSKENFDE